MRIFNPSVPLLCIAFALSGCHGDSGAAAAPVHLHFAPKKGPSASDLTRGMVDAAGVGKSQLDVDLKFDLRDRPVLGQPVSIEVAVLPQVDGDPATLAVNGVGITMTPEAANIALPAVVAGGLYRQTLIVTPGAEGVLVLSVNVTIHHDEVTESRMFSIPLIVDPARPPTAAK